MISNTFTIQTIDSISVVRQKLTQLNFFQLDATSIFYLLFSVLGLLLPIVVPILMSILGWRSELKFYQTRLTRIFLETV